jgi:hypothetical protein
MKEASLQERKYLESIMDEGDMMLSNGKQIQRLIENRLVRYCS